MIGGLLGGPVDVVGVDRDETLVEANGGTLSGPKASTAVSRLWG